MDVVAGDDARSVEASLIASHLTNGQAPTRVPVRDCCCLRWPSSPRALLVFR
jgi:hypothetical protein